MAPGTPLRLRQQHLVVLRAWLRRWFRRATVGRRETPSASRRASSPWLRDSQSRSRYAGDRPPADRIPAVDRQSHPRRKAPTARRRESQPDRAAAPVTDPGMSAPYRTLTSTSPPRGATATSTWQSAVPGHFEDEAPVLERAVQRLRLVPRSLELVLHPVATALASRHRAAKVADTRPVAASSAGVAPG